MYIYNKNDYDYIQDHNRSLEDTRHYIFNIVLLTSFVYSLVDNYLKRKLRKGKHLQKIETSGAT